MAWTGDCNQCGQCCSSVSFALGKATTFHCVNLLVSDRIGNPGATSCAYHKTKYDGMPILMLTADGKAGYPSKCMSTYPRTQDAVPPECSFVWVKDIVERPEWSLTYGPRLEEELRPTHSM